MQNSCQQAQLHVICLVSRLCILCRDLPPPPVTSYRVKLAVKAIADAGPGVSKKAPIMYQLLLEMCNQLSTMDLCVLWRAMLALGYYGALRGSEYAATTQDGIVQAPLVSDLKFTSCENKPAMVYTIRRSKTQRAPIQVPIGCTSTECCAVCYMTEYLVYRRALGTLHPHSYLFVTNDGRPVSKLQLDGIIKQLVHKCGLHPSSYSAHSLRSGAATAAHQAGFTESQIKALGHWASSAYTGYIRQSNTQGFKMSHRLVNIT